MGEVLFSGVTFFPLEACGGTAHLRVNLGPLHISGTVRARNLKFYTHLDKASAVFKNNNFSDAVLLV